MASVVSSKRNGEGVIVEMQMSDTEALRLNGHLDNIHVVAEQAACIPTNISLRGKNDATKYLLIPKSLRQGMVFNNEVRCQKLDTDSKTIFVYVIDKAKQKQ